MKKFTENINENVDHYAGDKKIYNEIYNLIEETLSAKMDGEDSEKVTLIGKEDLVKELSKIVENEITRSKIKVLESFKATPGMITERVESKNELSDIVNEAIFLSVKKTKEEVKNAYKKIAQTIQSCETLEQCDTAKNMIDNFDKKFDRLGHNMGSFEGPDFQDDIEDRVKELEDELKSKRSDIKKDKK